MALSTVTDTGPRPTAIVSGASRGIGRAVALRLAGLGFDLLLMARDRDALTEVCAACEARGVTATACPGDLTDDDYLSGVMSAAEGMPGAVEVLVNNAGTALRGPVQDADIAAWDRVMDINFGAMVRVTRLVVPGMIERRRGTIINISSISGRSASAGSAIYCASKHALNGFGGCLYEDVRDFGIKVSTIMPGYVDTALTAELDLHAAHMIRADDIADSVAYVLSASPHCCPTEIVLRPQLRP